MSSANAKPARPADLVRKDLIAVLQQVKDSAGLRPRLEELSREYAFPGLTHLWGPELYARAPVFFRPFIMAHFSSHAFQKKWRWQPVEWKGEVASRLEGWLAAVERAGDVELYRMLYGWRLYSTKGRHAAGQWQVDLAARFQAATDSASRRLELSRHDLPYWLEESTAVTLYRLDSRVATPFILRHLPRKLTLLGEKRVWWQALAGLAREAGDEDLYFSLYRQQASMEEWRRDVLELARTECDSQNLLRELRRRHLQIWQRDMGSVFSELLAQRGEEVFPYVLPEVSRVLRGWLRDGFEKLMALSEQRGWMELWGALMRACASPAEWESAMLAALQRGPDEARRRVMLLAGVGSEWSFGGLGLARRLRLTDKAACAVYEKYPDLLRGPLRGQLIPIAKDTYQNLTGKLIGQSDDLLLDFLASRFVTCRAGVKAWRNAVERMSDYYEAMQREQSRFACRAARVLGMVPAMAVWRYDELIRDNRLARLLYERSAAFYLQQPDALVDLIEASEIHAQALAYRALALDSDQARLQARENLDILLGTLLRPLHRRTRLLAFGALENAARDPEAATRIVQRGREALALPDSHYPKDQLMGLLGRILQSHPQLRLASEQPLVYRRAAACSE